MREAGEVRYNQHFKWPCAVFLLLFSRRGWWSYLLLEAAGELESEVEIITRRNKATLVSR